MPDADRSPGTTRFRRGRRLEVATLDLATASEQLTLLAIGSIAPGVELTLMEYCALSTVATRGSHALRQLAEVLDTEVTTVSAISQRLVVVGLAVLTSSRAAHERRLVASTAGRALVDDVARRRRRAIAETLDHLDPTARRTIADNLRQFAALTTERPNGGACVRAAAGGRRASRARLDRTD